MDPSVSQSHHRCACGRPAVGATGVCCLLCAGGGHSRFCDEVTAYRPGAVSDPAAPPTEPNNDHVVLDYQTSKLGCGHCGAEETLVLPMSVSVLVDRTDAFLEQHGSCQPKASKESR